MNNLISNIRFTIGTGKTKTGKPISTIQSGPAIKDILMEIATKFGGYTIQTANGGWYDSVRKTLVEESVVVINVAVIEIDQHDIHNVIKSIVAIANERLDQQCVLVQLSYGTSELI